MLRLLAVPQSMSKSISLINRKVKRQKSEGGENKTEPPSRRGSTPSDIASHPSFSRKPRSAPGSVNNTPKHSPSQSPAMVPDMPGSFMYVNPARGPRSIPNPLPTSATVHVSDTGSVTGASAVKRPHLNFQPVLSPDGKPVAASSRLPPLDHEVHRVRFSSDAGGSVGSSHPHGAVDVDGGAKASAAGSGEDGASDNRQPIWSRKDAAALRSPYQQPFGDDVGGTGATRGRLQSDGGPDDDDDGGSIDDGEKLDGHGRPIKLPKWLEVEAQRAVQGHKPPLWHRTSISAGGSPAHASQPVGASSGAAHPQRSLAFPTDTTDFSEDEDEDAPHTSAPQLPRDDTVIDVDTYEPPVRSSTPFRARKGSGVGVGVSSPPSAVASHATHTPPKFTAVALATSSSTPSYPHSAPVTPASVRSAVKSSAALQAAVTAHSPSRPASAAVPVANAALPPHLRR